MNIRKAAAVAVVALSTVGSATAAHAFVNPTFGPTTNAIGQTRGAGSDTTVFMQQSLAGLFAQSPGCSLDGANFQTCATTQPAGVNTQDNYDHDEVINAFATGSGNGIKQLCGQLAGTLPVNFARSSRERSVSDCNSTGATSNQSSITFRSYAKDGIVPINFPATTSTSAAAGWRTGDTVSPSGNAVTSLTKQNLIDILGPSPKVTDWGQLTDKTANIAATPPTYGTADNQPIVVWGVQTGSGTYLTYKSFLGVDPNTNACAGTAATPQPYCGTTSHIIFENNAAQITNISNTELCAPATPNCAASLDQESRSLYFMSYGRYASNPYTRGNGQATAVSGIAASPATIARSTFPITRFLYNVFVNTPFTYTNAAGTFTVPAATAPTMAFLNWQCNNGSTTHGVDPETGVNYDTEIGNVIGNANGFVRTVCADS